MTSTLTETLPARFWDPRLSPCYDAGRGTWDVFSYADVSRTLTAAGEFSQAYGDPGAHPNWAVMWAADDPRHADLKAAAREPFRPGVLHDLAPSIRDIAGQLIDRIHATGSGRFEVMTALARPLAGQVICRIMGVDLADDELFTGWLRDFTAAQTVGTTPQQPEMVSYFTDLLDRHRRGPQAGLIGQLIAAQRRGHCIAGEPLSDRDLIGYLWGLLAAGSDTTATGLANMLVLLDDHGHMGELHADRALLPAAVDETLRWYPPFPANMVITKTNVTFAGHQVPAGQCVTGWLTSANRDPAVFPDPDVFDIRRRPNPHLTFARGAHHCLGAPLARLELQIILDMVLDRLPGLRRDRELPFGRTLGIVNSVDQAHFVFGRDRGGAAAEQHAAIAPSPRR